MTAGRWYRGSKGRRTIASGLALVVAFAIGTVVPAIGTYAFAAAMLVGLAPIARRAVMAALAGTPVSIEMLMTIAALGALAIGDDARHLLSMVAALETGSSHPLALAILARAILARAKAEGVPVPPASDASALGGQGVTGRVGGVDLSRMVDLSRRTMVNIRQNVTIALGLKALFLVTTVAGLTGLWPAILADTGATVLVTANAMRPLSMRKV